VGDARVSRGRGDDDDDADEDETGGDERRDVSLARRS
jgi:hypothetical protein